MTSNDNAVQLPFTNTATATSTTIAIATTRSEKGVCQNLRSPSKKAFKKKTSKNISMKQSIPKAVDKLENDPSSIGELVSIKSPVVKTRTSPRKMMTANKRAKTPETEGNPDVNLSPTKQVHFGFLVSR